MLNAWKHTVLSIVAALALSGALGAFGSRARAEVPSALVPRRAITAGGHDHYRPQLSLDGRDVYFLGNESRTAELFVQNLERGFPRLLLDESAEVGLPRLSPDGKHLLFVSYRRYAGGDACVFEIERQRRFCVTREGTTVHHVFWFPDGRVGALVQASPDAPHEVRRFPLDDGEVAGSVIHRGHLATPEISPDGRWLVFVPLEPREGRRGLRRASDGLVVRDLRGERELRIEPLLPGTTSGPVFSRDGRHLYFVQHPNDTNFDGTIDEDDRGVLYRVPFDANASAPIRVGTEEQLTSGSMDCQHPAPAADRLVATCVRGEHLQIDSMPLEGLFVPEWDLAKVQAERAASRDPSEQIGLLARELTLLRFGGDPTAARLARRELVTSHLALHEYESAEHHAEALAAEAVDDAHLRDWVAVMRELIAHRRAEQRLPFGNLDAVFVAAERERSARLATFFASEDASIGRLARLVDAEITLVLGDATDALARFDEVRIDEERDPNVVQLWGTVADALLRIAGERRRWRQVHAVLAAHPALSLRERLHHAKVFVDVTVRGRRVERAREQLAEAREGLDERSPLALFIDVRLAIVAADEAARAEGADASAIEAELRGVLDGIWARVVSADSTHLESRQPRQFESPQFESHRAIAMTVIERASHRDWTELARHVARTWRDELPVDHPERKYSEVIYEQVVLELAYVELDRGRSPRALFRKIADDTKSLEGHLGYFEAALREGVSAAALREESASRFAPESPLGRFAEAYLAARELDALTDPEAYAAESARLEALLHPVAEDWPRAAEVHHLYAFLAHRRYRRTGDSDSRRAAHARYYLALDLAPHTPRRRASLLEQVGQLQSELGNHRIALGLFDERERLPFRTPASELSFRLSKARSLFHVGSYELARTELLRGRDLMEANPELATYRPLVLDRAALYSFASGEYERALRLYGRLVEIVDPSAESETVTATATTTATESTTETETATATESAAATETETATETATATETETVTETATATEAATVTETETVTESSAAATEATAASTQSPSVASAEASTEPATNAAPSAPPARSELPIPHYDVPFTLAVRMKARLGRAAAAVAVGELAIAQEELERVRAMLDDPAPFRDETARAHRRAESHFERDDYRPIVAGLLAVARRGEGDVAGAYETLRERHAIYEARYERYERDAYLLELARIDQQLAENAYRRGELALARRHVEAGLRAADEYTERTESELDETTVALVRAAAELRLYGGVPASAFEIDVLARLRDTFRTIARVTDGRFAHERFLFPIYVAALETPARGAPRERD